MEEECNDTYGRIRMYQALTLKQPENVEIPSERTVYRVMEEIGSSHCPRHKPNGITKADRQATKSDNLLKHAFHAEEPLTKCVTDITEIKAGDGKLYVSVVFRFSGHMEAELCQFPNQSHRFIQLSFHSSYTMILFPDYCILYAVLSVQSSLRQPGFNMVCDLLIIHFLEHKMAVTCDSLLG